MISLTIDGKKVEVPQGTTVLRAAEKADIHIPTLCDHAHLTPYGSCRLCLVQIEGARTLQTSCTLPASDGMVVYTDTPEIQDARKFVLTLLFSERNHFCMYCPVSDSDCELQESAYEQDMTSWPLQPNWDPYPVDGSHEYFVLDNNRCILCRRCTRACAELVGNFTLGIQERGANSKVIADLDVPLGESSCVSCGTCIQVCPTGALIDRVSAYQGREKDVERIKSTCTGCSVGCGIEMIVRDNRLLRIEGDWDAPSNAGVICEIGRFKPLAEERERVVTPLVRRDGELKAATWDDALDLVADKIKSVSGSNGNGVAALSSTLLTTESLYKFQQVFGEQLGSDMVTSIEEGVPTALPGWVARKRGKPFEGTLDDIKSADCVIAMGVDLAANHQVAGFLVKRALPTGTKLVVIDPFDNGLAELANYYLRPKQGSDYDLLTGLMSVVSSLGLEKKKVSTEYDLTKFSAEAASHKTGIPTQTIQAVARLIGTAQNPVFIYGKGIIHTGFPTVLEAFLELASVVGALDDEHSGVISTKGQANSVAAYQYGLDKAFEPKGHEVIYLAMADDHASRRLTDRLAGAPFIAVQASYLSPVTEMADVVLPVETWAEQEGHFLNLEGRLQQVQRGLVAPPEVKSNSEVLDALADHLKAKLASNWQEALSERIPTNQFV